MIGDGSLMGGVPGTCFSGASGRGRRRRFRPLAEARCHFRLKGGIQTGMRCAHAPVTRMARCKAGALRYFAGNAGPRRPGALHAGPGRAAPLGSNRRQPTPLSLHRRVQRRSAAAGPTAFRPATTHHGFSTPIPCLPGLVRQSSRA